MNVDIAHVLLDALAELDSRIQSGYEPWREYDGEADADPKLTREGYRELLASARTMASDVVANG